MKPVFEQYNGNNEYCLSLSGVPEYVNSGVIVVKDDYDRKYIVSRIDYERYDDQNYQYVFTLNWPVIDVLPATLFQGIPGLDLSLRHRKYYRVNMTPYFITERSPSENREDLKELLDEVKLDYYDRFEWILRAQRKCGVDNLLVERVHSSKTIVLRQGNYLNESLQPHDCVIIENWSELGADEKQIHHNLMQVLGAGAGLFDKSEDRFISEDECCTLLKLLMLKEEKRKQQIKSLQKCGIERAKSEGKYKGRKKQEIDWHLFEKVSAEFKSKTINEEEAMKRMKISSRSTFYRRLKELHSKKG